MDGWMDGWVVGWVYGWVDRWMDGWVGGWMDKNLKTIHYSSEKTIIRPTLRKLLK
jgi:hypothetical protein